METPLRTDRNCNFTDVLLTSDFLKRILVNGRYYILYYSNVSANVHSKGTHFLFTYIPPYFYITLYL